MAEDIKQIISHSKEYGFVYPSSEIYEGLSAVYDYGPMGVELKNNLKSYWWKSMVRMNENIVGLDAAIFMHPRIWKASGHVDAFNDPMLDNRDSNRRYRADVLIEEEVAKIENKIEREIKKGAKRFGEDFDEKQFRETHPRIQRYTEEINDIKHRLGEAMSANDMAGLKAMIEELNITDPVSGSKNWTDVRQFNLMFSTQLGNISGESSDLYLRPETAQGIFVNFLNVLNTSRQKIPFGIAQIGKAFRNEIVARQFIFRMREFEQMEMQYFIPPGTEMEWYEHWKEIRMKWHQSLGLPAERMRFHDHQNLSHYANAATDIEYQFPFGFKELEGIHSRTDFDLKNHQEFSGKKMQYFDQDRNETYIPYVLETSAGSDRLFLAQMSHALREEEVPDASGKASTRTVMKFHPAMAPVKAAVLPLVRNKPALTEHARKIYDDIKINFQCQYDDKDAIGRRYRRQDAIGTPYCITIDFETIEEDQKVTLRDRDTLEQKRVTVEEARDIILRETNDTTLLQ